MSGDVVAERVGACGIARLNRPKALNALTLGMIRELQRILDGFAADPSVAIVLLEGEGERAFCAGGDIRAIHESGREGGELPAMLWREEYELNAAIAAYEKPLVVLMHGIVMGGGAGLSIHAAHRIVTDTTRFAMPEVGIGFVPDVGATWRLPKAPGRFGWYLALTGATVGPADVIAAGLADAMVPAERWEAFRTAVTRARDAGEVEAVIAAHRAEPVLGVFATHAAEIEQMFALDSPDENLKTMQLLGTEFASETRATILSRSPSSLRDTAALLAAGARSASPEECLTREFWAALGTLERPDFYEGVRAAIIDKDRSPRWSPATLAEIPEREPESFAPVPGITPPFAAERE